MMLARYALIMEKTSDVQGDMLRTGDNVANLMRGIKEQFLEIAQDIGKEFLPTAQSAMLWIAEEGIPAVRLMLTRMKQSWKDMGEEGQKRILLVAGLLVAGGPLFKAVGFAISTIASIAMAFNAIILKAGLVVGAVVAIGTAIKKAEEPALSWGEAFASAWGGTLSWLGNKAKETGLMVAEYLMPGEGAKEALFVHQLKEEVGAAQQAYDDLIKAEIELTRFAQIRPPAEPRDWIGMTPEDLREFFGELNKSNEMWARAQVPVAERANEIAEALSKIVEKQRELGAVDAETQKLADSWSNFADIGGIALDKLADGVDLSLGPALNKIKQWWSEIESEVHWEDPIPFLRETMLESEKLPEIRDPLELVKEAWEDAADAMGEAGKAAKAAGVDISGVVSDMVSQNPLIITIGFNIQRLKDRIAELAIAQRANQAATRMASRAMQGLQETLSSVSKALSDAKSKLDDLTRPQLKGMGELGDQMFQIEQHIKRMKLTQAGIDTTFLQPQTKAAKSFVATLPNSVQALERMLEQMQLTKSLKFDEQLKLIEKAAKPLEEELTFEEAMEQVAKTKEEIAGLEQQVLSAEAAVRAQQAAIQALQDAAFAMAEASRLLQEELAREEKKHDLVSEALQMAYKWFLEDRQAMIETGAEGVKQAKIIDAETRKLLLAVTEFVQEEGNQTIGKLHEVVREYEAARAAVAAGIDIFVRRHVEEIVTQVPASGRQHGGPVSAGRSYVVGEVGPELFVPQRAGHILPNVAGGSNAVIIYGDVYGFDDFEDKLLEAKERATRRGRW
jgi:hypothetical protein